MERLQCFFDLSSQIRSQARVPAPGGNRHLHVAALDAGRYEEAAFLGGIGDVREDSPAFGRDAYAVIDEAIVGSGEDEGHPGQVRGSKVPCNHTDRQLLELRLPLRRYHCHARARFQQSLDLAKRDLAGPDYQDRLIFQVEENRIMPQTKR